MGKLLRRFWQPVATSASIAAGRARGIRILSEDLTVYRGDAGVPHLLAGRCAHRGTVLHTGWVERDDLRCMYHGWRYDSTGLCVEIPAEPQGRERPLRIAGYPVHEYSGLIFAYLGEGAPPAFSLPRKHMLEEPGRHIVTIEQAWDCNWFQQIENSLDAVHVSFVHTWGKSTRFDQGITTSIPALSYEETSSGIRQTATRGKDNVRVSDWTFPNNNHVLLPGPSKGDPWSNVTIWRVPIDERRTMRFAIASYHASMGEEARLLREGADFHYNPADDFESIVNRHLLPEVSDTQMIAVQDYAAVRGQGTIANRPGENLSTSDAGILFVRKIFQREMEAIRLGQPTKAWAPLEEKYELPVPAAERQALQGARAQ
ncbi:MAG: iron-sulfur containing oxygenase [Betaproteobacteria bacterium]|nr:iron-sulfur containing oxygenase [Betaproteobacteria bacterium]